MTKNTINKISDKLSKVNESFAINMYDNGFMIEVGGQDHNEEWANVKLMVKTVDELVALIRETVEMDRNN